MSTLATAAAPADGNATPKKSKKKLIIIIAAVALALGAGGGWYFMNAKSHAKPADMSDEDDEDEDPAPAKAADSKAADSKAEASKPKSPKKGKKVLDYLVGDPLYTVNLADEENDRYLQRNRKNISFQYANRNTNLRRYANRQFRNVISINVISNNCSPFSHRLHPRALQRAEIEIERLICKETGPLAPLFLRPPPEIEIWDGNALSASYVQVLRRVPRVLRGRCSLLSSQGCSLLSGQGQTCIPDEEISSGGCLSPLDAPDLHLKVCAS